MSQKPSVLILELYPYHTHNFSVYKNLLPSLLGCEDISIEYYVCPEVLDTLIYPDKKLLHRLFPSKNWDDLLTRYRLRTVYLILLIRLLCAQKKFDCVVLNTVESKADKKIFRSIKTRLKIAVIHNPGTVSFVRDANALYFCMNEYVFEEMAGSSVLDGYLLSYFRPVEFPVKFREGSLIISIPGGISFNRRDYRFLLEICSLLEQREEFGKKIVFNIIGDIRDKDGPIFRRMIEENNFGRYFRLHEGLDDLAFSREVSESDFLMPLIGNANDSYRSIKNTATLSHSARYGTPLLLQPNDAECWGIPVDCCVIYKDAVGLAGILTNINGVGADIATAYRDFIQAKIAKNRLLLSELGKRTSLNSRFG